MWSLSKQQIGGKPEFSTTDLRQRRKKSTCLEMNNNNGNVDWFAWGTKYIYTMCYI